MRRIFWDTNLFIYLLEDFGDLSKRVVELRQAMIERRDQLLTSALTLGELLVKPMSAGREDLCRAYEQALRKAATVVPFDAATAPRYARIRSDRTIKPPDALQLATAAQAGADLFITNDDRLSRKIVEGIGFVSSLERAPI